jgi:hypothetical protein
MSALKPTQLPAVDDINSDALEYLFAPDQPRTPEPPWVKMSGGPEPVARISPQIVRLQAKVESLVGQIELTMQQLQSANYEVGYLKAKLADADQQLKLLADYRAKAALAILGEFEMAALKRQIVDLESKLQQLAPPAKSPTEADSALVANQRLSRLFATYGSSPSRSSAFGLHNLALMPFIYLLMLGFAAAILATILN